MAVDPSLLRIVHYPDPSLRVSTQPIEAVTDEVRAVARRMIELMFEARGIGLAAPQIGLDWRMFVAHVPSENPRDLAEPCRATAEPQVYINPVISDLRGDLEIMEEGCLSLPEIRGDVLRPARCSLTATGLDGERRTVRGSGLLARCWQHETDHLDGVLIIDRFLPASTRETRGLVEALERKAR